MLKLPLLLTATLPTYTPRFLPLGTTALTRSPVRKPLTLRDALADVRGKPYLSIRHICLDAQRRDFCHVDFLRCALADAGGVYPMPFGQASPRPVELCQSTCGGFERLVKALDPHEERAPC